MIMLQGVRRLESSRSIDRASWAGRLLDLGQGDQSAACTRSNREKKKPEKEKVKTIAAAPPRVRQKEIKMARGI